MANDFGTLKFFSLDMMLGEGAYLKKSEYRGSYSHIWFDLRRRKVDFWRWLSWRLHRLGLLLVHFWGLFPIGRGIEVVPFLLPSVQGPSSVYYTSPRHVLFMTTCHEFEKLNLLLCIEMCFQCTTSNQLFLSAM